MKDIIFDFDGTLADSLPVVIKLFEEVMKTDQPLSKVQIERYRNMTAQAIVKELRIPFYRIPGLLVRGRTLLGRHMEEIGHCKGVPALVESLHKNGHRLFIISSNSPHNINMFLKLHGLEQYFTRVYGSVGVFGKAPAIKAVIKREQSAKSNALYIGDETRDVEAARKFGIPIISVTWGYNGSELLRQYNPDGLADTGAQVRKLVATI